MVQTTSIIFVLFALLKLTSAQTVRSALGSNLGEKDDDLAEARIVGGENVSKGDFPYFVRLDVNSQPICGGSLVSPNVVLTAAHCKPGAGIVLTVTVNAYDNGAVKDDQYKRNISYMLSHPDFYEKQYYNDLMLLKLEEAVTSIPYVKLNVRPDRPLTGEQLAVMGLGALEENGSFASWLQVTHVQAIDNSICNALYEKGGTGPILDDMMFCAGDPSGLKDSCQGDSGGPIIDSRGQQVGVTSFGVGCARKEYPGVYARVATEENWLLDQICHLTDNEYVTDLGFCGQAPTLSPTLRPTWTPTPWPTPRPTRPPAPDSTSHVASSGQDTGNGLLTTMAGGNGQAGNMFDIKANHDIQITGFDLHTRHIGSVYKALVLTKPGSYIGYETNHKAWTPIQYTMVLSQGESNFTSMPPLAKPLVIYQGQRHAFYITLVDSVDMLYTTGDETGAVFVSDSNIEFFQGIGNSFPFGDSYSPRIWNGIIKYEPVAPIPHL